MQARALNRMVNPDMSLVTRYSTGKIDNMTRKEIERQSLEVLRSIDPLMYHICRTRLVCNPKRNFITFYIDNEYDTLVYHVVINKMYYCFFVSSKPEPFIIITVVCPDEGRLLRLTRSQSDNLTIAIDGFKKKYSVVRETYHYTSLKERNIDTALFDTLTKAHSGHFHLKMRIATRMMIDLFPAMRLLDINLLKTRLEPVQHFFSRDCVSYADVCSMIANDIAS